MSVARRAKKMERKLDRTLLSPWKETMALYTKMDRPKGKFIIPEPKKRQTKEPM